MRYSKIQKKNWGKILRVEKKLHIKLIQLMNKKKKRITLTIKNSKEN